MFKRIDGFENYVINENGVVINTTTNHIKKPSDNNMGYLFVDLYNCGKHKREYIHRLVAKAFIPNIENKPYINHIDGNPHNNSVENLEWCTPKENVEHASKVLKVMKAYSIHTEKCKKKIYVYDFFTDKLIGEYSSLTECAKIYKLNVPNIIENAKSQNKKQLKGLYFVYEKDLGNIKKCSKYERTDITCEKVAELKKQGLTYKEMAEKLYCSEKVIYNRLKKMGYIEELVE